MIDPQVAIDKLNGMTSTEIRHFLRLEGIKGRRGSSNCPIAVWLKQVTGLHDILVGASMVHDGTSYFLDDGPKEFIGRFDDGDYNELYFRI